METNRIKDACHNALANRAYAPHDGITYCNVALHHILTDLGYDMFAWDVANKRPLMANDIAEKAANTLQELNATDAAGLALDGAVVIACLKEPFHGHVAVIYPFASIVHSGKWNADIPVVANIGKDVGVMGVNYAFGAMPKFYKVGM